MSGTQEKGEGEYKIINLIKNNIIKNNSLERTVVYSPDSDMIILLMMLNNDNVILYKCDGFKNAYDGNIIYDGTNGKYRLEQNKKNIHYLTQKDKLIL